DGGLPKRPGFETGVLVADTASEIEHQAGRDRGRSVAEGGRSANDHVMFFCGVEIDGSIAHAGGDEKFQFRQPLDHGAREGGPLAHGANDAEALQGCDHVVDRTERLVENLNVDVVGHFRPIGHRERDILVIVKDCAAKRHQLLVVRAYRGSDPNDKPTSRKTGNDKSGFARGLSRPELVRGRTWRQTRFVYARASASLRGAMVV